MQLRKSSIFERLGRQALALAAFFAFSSAALAQENRTSAPEALQFPFEAQPNAATDFSLRNLRLAIQNSVDLVLCNALMTRGGETIPNPFVKESCLPNYAARVAANDGEVHWASGARPLSCGQNCFGRPFMAAEDQLNRPNLRRAQVFGRITLTIDPPGPTNRDITFGYTAFFTCRPTNDGGRDGNLILQLKFDQPVIGDPGIVESIVSNLFTAGELSRYIEAEIRRQLPGIGTQQSAIALCRSVGVLRSDQPSFDAIRFDLPGSNARGVRAAAVAAATGNRVRIEFFRIVRNALPPLVAQEHGRPGDPVSGQFAVHLNGVTHFFPPQGLVLPVAGGTAPLNFCTTLDVTGWDRFQILFTNDLGGAAWSQFPRSGGFGRGTHTLTTGRTIVVPGLPGPPNPVTGISSPSQPRTEVLGEFELLYRITFIPAPTVAQATPASPPSGGVRPGLRPSVNAVNPAAPAPQPCREV